jgi:hypothetical protein
MIRFASGLLAGLWLAVAVHAQQPPQEAAVAPVPDYRSAFETYKPFSDQSISSWREVNDSVGRIGGWRVYAKEARQPESARPQPATDPKDSSRTSPWAPAGSAGSKP